MTTTTIDNSQLIASTVSREDMPSIKKQARFAGFLYLLLGISAPIGLM